MASAYITQLWWELASEPNKISLPWFMITESTGRLHKWEESNQAWAGLHTVADGCPRGKQPKIPAKDLLLSAACATGPTRHRASDWVRTPKPEWWRSRWTLASGWESGGEWGGGGGIRGYVVQAVSAVLNCLSIKLTFMVYHQKLKWQNSTACNL